MRRPPVIILVLQIIALFSSFPACAERSAKSPQASTEAVFSHKKFNTLLSSYVSEDGLINYGAIKAKPLTLYSYLEEIAELKLALLKEMDEGEQIAFYINAYNALTIKSIVENYPIQSTLSEKLQEFPKNSIRQIKGVWKKNKHHLHGEMLSLDEIEHKILRVKYNEPRIHMALVCAALSCPPLRAEAYTGGKLEKQLAEQSEVFLKTEAGLRVNSTHKGAQVFISPIFKWFGRDFIAYKNQEIKGNWSEEQRAVLGFVRRYAPAKIGDSIEKGNYSLKYSDYDWTLNELLTGNF